MSIFKYNSISIYIQGINMFNIFRFLLCFSLVILSNLSYSKADQLHYSMRLSYKQKNPQFIFVGAGAANIAAIGAIIEVGVSPEDIIWLDPEFNVGRLGQYYESVPSNTKTKLFIDFLEACEVFKNCSSPAIDRLKECDKEKEYPLEYIVEALRALTHYLSTKVHCVKGTLKSLYYDNNLWHINTEYINISSPNVVLGTGSHPKTLNYDRSKEIPLDIALNPNELNKLVALDDTVLVVGGCHSAILLLKYLSEISVKKIINIYKKPIQYAVDMGDWILYNSSGLKGATAQWAKDVLEKNPPKNLVRLYSNDENIKKSLKECTKIIYAIGYERNELPLVKENPAFVYNETTGVIAPGLFGIGIAFPEKYTDPLGNTEHRVGLASFMEYAQRVAPYWVSNESKFCLRQKLTCLKKYESLFDISLL